MIKLGSALLLRRGKKPGQCTQCQEVIQEELYYVTRQKRRSNGRFFYRYLHIRCISEFLFKTWERLERRPAGRPQGSGVLNLGPEDRKLHREYSLRYRYLEKRIIQGVANSTLKAYLEEFDQLESWLKENSRITTFQDKWATHQKYAESQPESAALNKKSNKFMSLSLTWEQRRLAAAGLVKESTSEGGQLEGIYYTPGQRRRSTRGRVPMPSSPGDQSGTGEAN